MPKKSVFLLFLITIFSVNLFAQTKSISASNVGFVKAKDDSEILNRPRVVELPKAVSTVEFEHQILVLLNQKRAESGLEPLRWSEDAAKIARLHSENMAEYKFFSHAGRDGLMVDDRADALGFSKWKAIGENIAYNRGFEKPIEFACESWMKSDSHRRNILNKRWQETGIGIKIAADGTYYFTQVFVEK